MLKLIAIFFQLVALHDPIDGSEFVTDRPQSEWKQGQEDQITMQIVKLVGLSSASPLLFNHRHTPFYSALLERT